MKKLLTLILTVIGLHFIYGEGKWIPKFAGPYIISLKTITNDSDEFNSTGEFWIHQYFTHLTPNQQQYTWGQAYSTIQLDDNLKGEVRMSTWNNNQWKRNAFLIKFDHACSDLLRYGKNLIDLYFEPHEQKCPFPSISLREIKNRTFEAVFPQTPVFPYGRYRFTLAFIKNDKSVVGVITAETDITPRL